MSASIFSNIFLIKDAISYKFHTHYSLRKCYKVLNNRIFATMKVLMVCLGNICRSPLAEGILQSKADTAGLNWKIDSAGTNGYHNGEAPHKLSQKVAKLNGIDISHQRSRKITASDLENYDLIYVMAGDVLDDIRRLNKSAFLQYHSKISLIMNELYPNEDRDVPDPWYGAEPGYHEVYEMLDSACNRIIEKYANK